jgi:hypothetical protein
MIFALKSIKSIIIVQLAGFEELKDNKVRGWQTKH